MMDALKRLLVVLLIDKSLSQICDNTIFCETFDGNLSLWTLDGLTNNPTKIVSHRNCPNNPCLRIEGNGGTTAQMRYVDIVISIGNNYTGASIVFDMYVGDIEVDGEGGSQIGNEYSGLQYSLDNGSTYIDGPIIYAHVDGSEDIGEKTLYSNLNVTIDDIRNIDNIMVRLVSFVSAGSDEIFYDNIRIYGIYQLMTPSTSPTKTPTVSPTVTNNIVSEYPSESPSKEPSLSPTSPGNPINISPDTSISKSDLTIIIVVAVVIGCLLCCLVIYLVRNCVYNDIIQSMDSTFKSSNKNINADSKSMYDGVYSSSDNETATPKGDMKIRPSGNIDTKGQTNEPQAAVIYNNTPKVVQFTDYDSLLSNISNKFNIDSVKSLQYQPEFSDFMITIENDDDLNQCLKQKKVNIIVNDTNNNGNKFIEESIDDSIALYKEGNMTTGGMDDL